MGQFPSRELTLAEHLLAEWKLVARTPEDKHIGEFIIGSMDSYGCLHLV